MLSDLFDHQRNPDLQGVCLDLCYVCAWNRALLQDNKGASPLVQKTPLRDRSFAQENETWTVILGPGEKKTKYTFRCGGIAALYGYLLARSCLEERLSPVRWNSRRHLQVQLTKKKDQDWDSWTQEALPRVSYLIYVDMAHVPEAQTARFTVTHLVLDEDEQKWGLSESMARYLIWRAACQVEDVMDENQVSQRMCQDLKEWKSLESKMDQNLSRWILRTYGKIQTEVLSATPRFRVKSHLCTAKGRPFLEDSFMKDSLMERKDKIRDGVCNLLSTQGKFLGLSPLDQAIMVIFPRVEMPEQKQKLVSKKKSFNHPDWYETPSRLVVSKLSSIREVFPQLAAEGEAEGPSLSPQPISVEKQLKDLDLMDRVTFPHWNSETLAMYPECRAWIHGLKETLLFDRTVAQGWIPEGNHWKDLQTMTLHDLLELDRQMPKCNRLETIHERAIFHDQPTVPGVLWFDPLPPSSSVIPPKTDMIRPFRDWYRSMDKLWNHTWLRDAMMKFPTSSSDALVSWPLFQYPGWFFTVQ